MRRRRKTKFTWFPVNGRTQSIDVPPSTYYGSAFTLTGLQPLTNSTAATQIQVAFPICPDFTEEQGPGNIHPNPQLKDIVEGQAWLLKRIVGSVHLTCNGSVGSTAPTAVWSKVLVTAGFFVARSDDIQESLVGLQSYEFDPQGKDNSMNPWIWRRTWLLRNPGQNPASVPIAGTAPTSTMEYGSVADGPKIDSKVARRITREHRLWWVCQVMGGDPNQLSVSGTLLQQPVLNGYLDIRILGAMRRNRNLSSF